MFLCTRANMALIILGCKTCCLASKSYSQPSLWSHTTGITDQDQGQSLWPSLHSCLGMPSLCPWSKATTLIEDSCMELLIMSGPSFGILWCTIGKNVWQLSTGYVSPQYCLASDDLFKTVFSTVNDALFDAACNEIFGSICNIHFYHDRFVNDYSLVYHLPSHDEFWLCKPIVA